MSALYSLLQANSLSQYHSVVSDLMRCPPDELNTSGLCSFLSSKTESLFDQVTIAYLLRSIMHTCVDAHFIHRASISELSNLLFPQCDVKFVILLKTLIDAWFLPSSLAHSCVMSGTVSTVHCLPDRTMSNVSHLSGLPLAQLTHADDIAVYEGKGFLYGALVTLGPAHAPSSSVLQRNETHTRGMLNRKLVLSRKKKGYRHSPTFDLFFIGSNIGDADYLGEESTEESYDMPLVDVQSQCWCIVVVDRLTCQAYLMNSIANRVDEKTKVDQVEVLNTQDSSSHSQSQFQPNVAPSSTGSTLWNSVVDYFGNGVARSPTAQDDASNVNSVFFAPSQQKSRFVKKLSEHIFVSRMEEDDEDYKLLNDTQSSSNATGGMYSPVSLPQVGSNSNSNSSNGNVMNEGSSLDSRLLANWKLILLKDNMIIHANGIKLKFVDPTRLSSLSDHNHMAYSREVISSSLNTSKPICPVALGPLHFSIEEQSVRARKAMMLLLQEARSMRRHFVNDKEDRKRSNRVLESVDEMDCMRYGSIHIDLDQHYNGNSSKSVYVFPKCGHIHSYYKNLEGRPCSLCREIGPYVSLKFACEPLIDNEKPTHVFSPCGHAASLSCCQKYSTIKFTASLLEPDAGNKYSICPFCACRLDDQMPFSRLMMQTENGSINYETSLPDAVKLSPAKMDIEDSSAAEAKLPILENAVSIADHLIEHRLQTYPKYYGEKTANFPVIAMP